MGADGRYRLWCAACGGPRVFEQPPCADGHGPDCPERACTGCGAAMLVGPAGARQVSGVAPAPDAPRRDLSWRAHRHRDVA
jgi:hypothetical protein